MFDGVFETSASSTIYILFILYISETIFENIFAISFAIFAEYAAFSFVTVIFITSVSSTDFTDTFFLSSSSFTSIPKFDITCLNTLLLFTSSLYVETNFEFNVTSVVVIEFALSVPADFSDPVRTKVVDELYFGVVNP